MRLTHPDLDFYVDVTVHERGGRYMATADLGDFYVDVTVHERGGRYMATADLGEDARDIGVGDTPQEAVRAALAALGEPYARELAEGVGVVDGRPSDT